ncbi:hypothetical protein H4R34_001918 [Dimargaris verticillata]|uniref:Uncharacterized protein n=1 Tax=Dimargaris verticillata TaxID=2761393 RepID=A0A9W8E9U0_9FUNG|nr:hypothetical protein H4R34_001918 [Dimargaris verticillata]
MADHPIRIRLVKGIQSGFAGPNTEEVVEIEGDLSQATVTRHVFVSRWDTETYKGVIEGSDLQSLLQNVDNLAQLPRQPEPFENDAYGENVGLSVITPDLTWSNGNLGGCNVPVDEQKVDATSQSKFRSVALAVLAAAKLKAPKKVDTSES